MAIKIFLYIVIIFSLWSCRPKGVLSSGQMEDLFVDLHRAEGIIYVKGYKNGHDSVVGLTYDSILAAHGVTRAQLDSSLVWYTDNPMLFDKIYPHVMERLEKMKEEEQAAHEEEIRREKEEMQRAANQRHIEDDLRLKNPSAEAEKTVPNAGRMLRKEP